MVGFFMEDIDALMIARQTRSNYKTINDQESGC